ncbi:MAG: enoyl-CoA hydratase/isomerase family protein [Nevskia sp.]|nr:enoyl-CoA hydratase/isomerase family protein [Nevskia sp.]
MSAPMGEDLEVSIDGHVATVEIRRPPNNFFDASLIEQIAGAYERLDAMPACRAIVLCSQGKNFCSGANLGAKNDTGNAKDLSDGAAMGQLYRQAVRIFRCRKPVIAAVQGAAIGGGLGLAVSADFRVTCEEARFSANFTRLGFHPGFGLTVTLPELIGKQRAALMFLTSRRIKGSQAVDWGLADVLVPLADVRTAALELAAEIAAAGPLAVAATRATLRFSLADRIARQTDHELAEQTALLHTADWKEGIAATAERREPVFSGR